VQELDIVSLYYSVQSFCRLTLTCALSLCYQWSTASSITICWTSVLTVNQMSPLIINILHSCSSS